MMRFEIVNAIARVLDGEDRFAIVHAEAWSEVLRDLPDGRIDALITDPPYSSGGFTRGDRMGDPAKKYTTYPESAPESFQGDNRDQHAFLVWCTLWLTECQRALRTSAPACVFSDWRQLPTVTDAFQSGGLVWRGIATWTKADASRPQQGRFRADAEFLVWGSNGHMPLDEQIGVLPGTFVAPPVPPAARLHTTEKPLSVMEQIVRIAPAGGVVLDPFMGSGTTGVAALRRGCRFIGIERSAHYAELARDRLLADLASSDLTSMRTGQRALFR